MDFWRDGILQFIYPQKNTCILCGHSAGNEGLMVCRPCYLALIWNPISDAIWAGTVFRENGLSMQVRTVAPVSGRMKQLLTLLDGTRDQKAMELAAELIARRAGSWLAEADTLAVLPDTSDDQVRSKKLDRDLVRRISAITGIPCQQESQEIGQNSGHRMQKLACLNTERKIWAARTLYFTTVADEHCLLRGAMASCKAGETELRILALAHRIKEDIF
jgi:hypothetical protein